MIQLQRYRTLLIVLGVLLVAGLLSLYLLAEPSSGLYPRCMFKELTGLSCPGCGSQRALHAVIHGDLRGAFSYNALLILEIPLLALLVISSLFSDRMPRLKRFLGERVFILLILATIIIWTIVRNIFDV
ncbi:MAG: DUF2752 domain-containing protein [Staphylococcus sp.]|nr:DUF2752 domain-containing protein [Staphylococcus sp.]